MKITYDKKVDAMYQNQPDQSGAAGAESASQSADGQTPKSDKPEEGEVVN